MMMNCFIRMVDRRKPFSLISSRGHSQRFYPSQISNKLQAGFKSVKSLGSDFAELSCATLCWIEMYSSNNHYTKVSLKNIYGSLSLSLSLSLSFSLSLHLLGFDKFKNINYLYSKSKAFSEKVSYICVWKNPVV